MSWDTQESEPVVGHHTTNRAWRPFNRRERAAAALLWLSGPIVAAVVVLAVSTPGTTPFKVAAVALAILGGILLGRVIR